MSNDLQQQFVQDMLTESIEGLDRYDAAILLLEKGEATNDTLNDVFRVVHSLKGTAGCLGFHRVEKLSHSGEHLLDALRSNQLTVSPEITSGLLKLSDSLRKLLECIEKSGSDVGSLDIATLAEELIGLRDRSESKVPLLSVTAAQAGVASPVGEAAPQGWGLFDDPSPSSTPLVAVEPAQRPAPPVPDTGVALGNGTSSAVANTASVRVDVSLLDKLMNLVGELVLSRNQLTQVAQGRQISREAAIEVSQRLNLVTTELQEGVMKTRMQPIGNVWAKFPRIVRDIAHEMGKSVRLETIGAETELDRTIIESIRDPLTHIIRNSIDHGVESPEKRAQAGKPAEGHILMRAYHEGGQVNIEIIDDGAGINLSRVRQKAIEKGLVSPEEGARLSEREVTNLIFLPGFSTAEKITNVSGRGVGMDVVKTNIEKIGGSVDLQTTTGQGTTLKIKIPLTLAIVPALIVKAGGERFAIPQVSLLELVRIDGKAAETAIENIYGSPVFRLRGQLLPLVFLHKELQLPAPTAVVEMAYNIIVLQADQRQFGLVVDDICDSEEIVVKPLGKHLKGLPMFAGATIMGDGRVALILDALGLAQHARIVSEGQEKNTKTTQSASTMVEVGERTQLLLFSLVGREHLALPLHQAARLEEFAETMIERSGAREAVQYRGRIMPLVRLAQHLPGAGANRPEVSGNVQVIVYQRAGRSVGLVVDQIRDIIDERLDLQPGSASPGILGSAVVQGKITDLVDIAGVLSSAGFELSAA